jgi:hypothetical protein
MPYTPLEYAIGLDADGKISATIEGKQVTEGELTELQYAMKAAYSKQCKLKEEQERGVRHAQVVAAQRVEVIAGVRVRIQAHIDHGRDIQAWLDEHGDSSIGAPWMVQIDGFEKKLPWTLEVRISQTPLRWKILCYADGSYRRYKSIAGAVKAALLMQKLGEGINA